MFIEVATWRSLAEKRRIYWKKPRVTEVPSKLLGFEAPVWCELCLLTLPFDWVNDMTQMISAITEILPFLKFKITPTSFSNVVTCQSCSIYSSDHQKNIIKSPKCIWANGYLTSLRRAFFSCWNVAGPFANRKDAQVKRNCPWWEVKEIYLYVLWQSGIAHILS